MNNLPTPADRSYEDFYQSFDSPLARQMRQEIYGKDIGQHSWVDARDLEHDIGRMRLSATSRLLDLGCGPGGPLAFVVGLACCHGTGLDLSASAIASAAARATELGLAERMVLAVADLDEPLSLARHSFDAVMSLDVVLHLRNRLQIFNEVARSLSPGGRFLFTDAGVLTGAVSEQEIALRALHGHTQFVPPGSNERLLEQAGLCLLERADRSASLLAIATRRHDTRSAHRAQLELSEGSAGFDRQQRYLETVAALARRGALSRVMHLAELRVAPVWRHFTPLRATG
jgi:SAM-dependent methyltransferase